MKADISTVAVVNFPFSDLGVDVHAYAALKEGPYRELIAKFHEIINF